MIYVYTFQPDTDYDFNEEPYDEVLITKWQLVLNGNVPVRSWTVSTIGM